MRLLQKGQRNSTASSFTSQRFLDVGSDEFNHRGIGHGRCEQAGDLGVQPCQFQETNGQSRVCHECDQFGGFRFRQCIVKIAREQFVEAGNLSGVHEVSNESRFLTQSASRCRIRYRNNRAASAPRPSCSPMAASGSSCTKRISTTVCSCGLSCCKHCRSAVCRPSPSSARASKEASSSSALFSSKRRPANRAWLW